MIGCMPTKATSRPFHMPHSTPTISAATSACATSPALGTGCVARIVAAAAPAIATTAPTEMSMPRVAITSVMPSATSTSGAARFRMSIGAPNRWPSSMRSDRKCGFTHRFRPHSSASVTHGQISGRSTPSRANQFDSFIRRSPRSVGRYCLRSPPCPRLRRPCDGRAARRCGGSRAAPRSISDEMNRMLRPFAHSASTRSMMSNLAATSMPRVGSSRISSFGSVASQRASSAFC